MACIVKERNGRLAYRLFWDGIRSWEGTGVVATDKRREVMEKKAAVMSQEMAEGRFDYLHWFPHGSKAHLFRPTPSTKSPRTLTLYVEGTWLPRKQPPHVRASLADTYRKHWNKHIKPAFGGQPFSAITTAALEDFKVTLTAPESAGGKGLKMKTARDMIDGTFRALYRDARKVDKFAGLGDPFADLTWPRKAVPEPDPFTQEERDKLLTYFWERKRLYYPFVYTLFFTGLRTGEAVGLRWGAVDLRQAKLTVRVSRTLGEDNPPKTVKSTRSVPLRPEVVAALRAAAPLHRSEDHFVFLTQAGTSLDAERFVEKHWRTALTATSIRPRKCYATRHTFISLTLMAGTVNMKRLADICGTSTDMIERHYARWMQDDTPAELNLLGGTAPVAATPSRPARARRRAS